MNGWKMRGPKEKAHIRDQINQADPAGGICSHEGSCTFLGRLCLGSGCDPVASNVMVVGVGKPTTEGRGRVQVCQGKRCLGACQGGP